MTKKDEKQLEPHLCQRYNTPTQKEGYTVCMIF